MKIRLGGKLLFDGVFRDAVKSQGIVALSSDGEGGNITLRVDDVLSLRNNSEISATAGEEDTSGDGGNIEIDSQFIVAFPQGNNDITANAFDGAGGNITIASEGIFGIQERTAREGNGTNDIDASSQFGLSGNVTINTFDVNTPEAGIEVPENLVDSQQTVAQACRSNIESGNRIILLLMAKVELLLHQIYP